MENISTKDFIASKKDQLTREIEAFITKKVETFKAETGFTPYITANVGTTTTQRKCGTIEESFVKVETLIKL